jgi:hypothetical protein
MGELNSFTMSPVGQPCTPTTVFKIAQGQAIPYKQLTPPPGQKPENWTTWKDGEPLVTEPSDDMFGGQPHMTMKQYEDAKVIMDRWQPIIMGPVGTVNQGLVKGCWSMGIADDGKGNPVFHITVEHKTKEVMASIPKALNGIPVVVTEAPMLRMRNHLLEPIR